MAHFVYEPNKFKLQSKSSWDCNNDDSSSLGYGSSGTSSSNYSEFGGAKNETSDFYKGAEFYDLDSVESFCIDGCCMNDECPNCFHESESSDSICSTSEQNIKMAKCETYFDIDEVEPTEQLQRFSQQRVSTIGMDILHSIEMLKIKADDDAQSESKCNSEDFLTKGRQKTNVNVISDDNHIYEEIHYDTPTINFTGVEPPPLPCRNVKRSLKFCPSKRKLISSKCNGKLFLHLDEQKTHL